MADLFNQQISATYSGLLKTSSSGVLSASLSQISDGRGNTSPLYLSTDSIQFYGAYSFPSSDGSANQVLKTDGAGVLTWEDDANSGTVTSVALSVPTGLTVTNSPITTSGTITIGGTLGVANGGTGATTLTGILLGNGTSAISSVTDGTVGQVLSTDGSGTYSFIDAATGDVSISGTPSTNEVAIWTNSNTIKGDASFTMSSSTFQINNSTASSQSNLIISNNDTAINSIPANIIFNSNTLTSYKTLAQIYATKTDADIANASGKLNFSTTDAGVPSVKFIINSNGLSEFLGNVNAYNTSSLKLYSLGQEGDSNTEFLEIKKSSTNAIFNVNKVGTGSVRGLEFQTGGSPKLTISSGGVVIVGSQPVPSWISGRDIIQLGDRGSINAINNSGNIYLNNNIYVLANGNNASVKAGGASQIRLSDNEILFYTSNVASAANEVITLTPKLTISSGGLATFSNGIKFGTGATLDAYEEDTYSPTLKGSTTAGSSPTGVGTYTVIGNVCHLNIRFSGVTVTGAGGAINISLPFAGKSGATGQTTSNFNTYNVSFTGTYKNSLYVSGSVLYGLSSVNGATWADWAIVDASNIYWNLSITYLIN